MPYPSIEHLNFVTRVSQDDETQVKTLRMLSSSLKILMVNWDAKCDGQI